MTNAARLREFRRRFDLNTEAAGRVLGLSSRAIEDIEQGRRRVGDRVLELALKNIKRQDVGCEQQPGKQTNNYPRKGAEPIDPC